MKRILLTLSLGVSVLEAGAQFSISPLSTFGWDGDGWFAPGENGYAYLGTANYERGLAYGNSHLYLVSRAGGINVRILDPLTGADLGGLDTTGISGGTYPLNMVGVGGDGAIYAANLTIQASTTPYKVYRWDTEASSPTVVYNGTPLTGGRVGDTLDVIGSGNNTRLVAGFGSSPATNGNNGYAIIKPADGTHTQVTFAGTPPNAGDFRLGITFATADKVLGTQGGGTGTTVRYTSYADDGTGTLLGSLVLPTSNAQRLLDYTVINGIPVLAAQSTGDSRVYIYDMSDPLNPVLLGSGNNTSGTLTANGNGTGSVAWGPATSNPDGTSTAPLWAMSSNQGIQAFLVTVPEPTTTALAALGGLLWCAWRAGRRGI